MLPDNWLEYRNKKVKFDSLPIEVGISPANGSFAKRDLEQQ
jgi:hypothetical protein